ncbi:hypothetical protein [Burkholderia gladioli]|uniref:hypothetical protein n=1 Tax=Burkholderia gladioli TaxID=28095 RepID=UPI0016405DB1|nr:hypothetical protein [Burkholderia gladioli]MBJ9676317.1 hypothetical protein [Burkholderia gladioli]
MFPAIFIALLGRRLVETPQFVVGQRIPDLRAEGRDHEAAALARDWHIDPDSHRQGFLVASFKGAC